MVKKIISGASRFRRDVYPRHKELFETLAGGQSPETLFITCADSRVDPSLITQAEPGDLFICRNAGNIVPPHVSDAGGVTATVEYAVGALGISHIVVCGHTDCGAMKGALDLDGLRDFPHVADWLSHSKAALRVVQARGCGSEEERLEMLTRENVLLQLQHLRTHPYVAAALSQGRLTLHGWVYDIRSGDIVAHNSRTGEFEPLDDSADTGQSAATTRETA